MSCGACDPDPALPQQGLGSTAFGASHSSPSSESSVFSGVRMQWNHFPKPATPKSELISKGWKNPSDPVIVFGSQKLHFLDIKSAK